MLKKKRLDIIGFIERANDSKWGATLFLNPKKNGTV